MIGLAVKGKSRGVFKNALQTAGLLLECWLQTAQNTATTELKLFLSLSWWPQLLLCCNLLFWTNGQVRAKVELSLVQKKRRHSLEHLIFFNTGSFYFYVLLFCYASVLLPTWSDQGGVWRIKMIFYNKYFNLCWLHAQKAERTTKLGPYVWSSPPTVCSITSFLLPHLVIRIFICNS